MGRQTGFYAHPDDYSALAEGLRSQGAVTIDDQSTNGEPVIRNIAEEHGSISVLLTHWRYLPSLRPWYSKQQRTWFYSVTDDLVAELSTVTGSSL